MSGTVTCARCGREAPPPSSVPWGGKLGDEIRSGVCADCWDEWTQMEVMVINELRLDFMDPRSQEVLTGHLREFLELGSGE